MKISQSIFSGSCKSVSGKPRSRAPEFAFIGRSNVGKSSLINMLCEKKDLARTSSMPGKTQLINYFLINGSWYLVDLPGYGFAKLSKKMQSDMKQMIQTFIGESEELSMLFVLIDARHVLMEIDRNFISAVASAGVPFAVVFTKSDKITSSALKKVCGENIAQIERIAPGTPSFITSAEKRKGREELLDFIETIYNKHTDIQSI